MTAALASSQTTALANPFAALTQRVKPINAQELYAVAQQIMLQDQSQQEAVTAATTTASYYTEAPATQATVAATTTTAAATPVAATTASTQAQATTASRSSSSGAVSIPSSGVAPRTQYDYWTKHIAQFAGKYLPDGPSMRPNCGPASVTMALRMIGLDIPGFSGQNSEAVLDKARLLATGKNDISKGTTDSELETLISKSGGKWSESTSFDELTGWVKQGVPVVLAGNPAYGWNDRYSNDQVYKFNGGHWVTVSGYDQATGHFIVNDPLSQIGPIYVSEAELRNYFAPRRASDNSQMGGLGIAVFRDSQAQAAA